MNRKMNFEITIEEKNYQKGKEENILNTISRMVYHLISENYTNTINDIGNYIEKDKNKEGFDIVVNLRIKKDKNKQKIYIKPLFGDYREVSREEAKEFVKKQYKEMTNIIEEKRCFWIDKFFLKGISSEELLEEDYE